MQVEGEGSRILRSNNWGRRNKDGRRESEGYIGLADTKVCQGRTKVFRIGELLSLIH